VSDNLTVTPLLFFYKDCSFFILLIKVSINYIVGLYLMQLLIRLSTWLFAHKNNTSFLAVPDTHCVCHLGVTSIQCRCVGC